MALTLQNVTSIEDTASAFLMSHEVPEQGRQKKAERYLEFVFHDVLIERQISPGYQVSWSLNAFYCFWLFLSLEKPDMLYS